MASKYWVMKPLAPLLAKFLFKNRILFGDYFHFGTFEKYYVKSVKCERHPLSALCSCYDVTINSSLMYNIIRKHKEQISLCILFKYSNEQYIKQ